MIRQLNAALLTYATRRSLWLAGGFTLLFFVLPFATEMAKEGRSPHERAQAAMFLLAFPAGGAAYLLASQGKWQFVDSRARVLPGYAAPHLAWLALLGIAGIFAVPLGVARAAGFSSLGAVASAVAVGVPYLWAMHRMDMLTGLTGIVAFFSLMTDAGRDFWLIPETAARYAAVHVGIIVAGAVALVAWLVRLTMLREEMSDYSIPTNAQSGSATRMERSQATRAAVQQLTRNPIQRRMSDWWHDRLTDMRAATVAGRQRLLRYGFAALPMEWQAACMAYAFSMVIAVLAGTSQMYHNGAGLMMPLAMFVMWPAMIPGQLLAMRRARLASESLLPLGRRDFINGLIVNLAKDVAGMWLIMQLALLALYLIIPNQGVPAELVVGIVAMSIAVQPMLFGLNLRVARYQSGLVRIVAMMGAMLPTIPAAAAIVLLARFHIAASLAAAVAAIGVGLWLVRSARDAWLVTELG